MTPSSSALIAILALVAVHLLSRHFRWLELEPRHRLLSAAGGVPVGYVFMQLLPALAHGQSNIERMGSDGLPSVVAEVTQHVSNDVYLVALASFIAFYGLERLVAGGHRTIDGATDPSGRPGAALCWLQVASCALTNALAGYLLVQKAEAGVGPLVLFTIAMGLWFLVSDRGLDARHGPRFDKVGRWALCTALVVGWLAGASHGEQFQLMTTVLQAVICGSVLLNVLAVEMPHTHRARFWPFALGAIGYSMLLLATER